MKRFARFAAVCLLTLPLGGCLTFFDFLNPSGRSILQGGPSITATVQNPIGLDEQYAIETGFASARRLGLAYVARPLCKAGQTFFQHGCAEPGSVIEIKRAHRIARRAVERLREALDRNPTISAVALIKEARKAVTDLANANFLAGAK